MPMAQRATEAQCTDFW